MLRLVSCLFVCSLVSVISGGPCYSEDNDPPDGNCDGSTYQMVECLHKLTEKWDRRLNKAYQEALKDGPKEQREQLRKAQRLWVQFRDANCMFYALGEGSIARLDAGECMRGMTETRAKELEGQGYRN